MKIQITKTFLSRSKKRILKKGEMVEGSEGWARKIEGSGLGTIIGETKRTYTRKKKVINQQEVETTSIESPNEQ